MGTYVLKVIGWIRTTVKSDQYEAYNGINKLPVGRTIVLTKYKNVAEFSRKRRRVSWKSWQ